MEEGWIKLYRDFLNWEWYDDGNMVRLFIHLLLRVNYEDKKWRGMVIKRGQIVTSLANLSAETGLSIKNVRTCLSKLQTTEEIVKQTASKFTIITICKYDKYQGQQDSEGQANGTETANKGQANGKQGATTKEYKEIKNIKEKIIKKEKPSFVAPEFEEVFAMWLEYKHQRRESYKSDLSLKTCYNKLYKLADGDPKTAMAIVEQSMANNWAGLFPLKDKINGNNRTSNWNQTNGAGREQRAAAYVAAIANLAAEDDARAAKVRRP